MIASQPLQNKTVMIPRGKAHSRSFSELVESAGGIPVEIPLIAFKPVAASNGILEYINHLHTYDWIIFTSNVTVETFFSFNIESSALPKIAVIGEKTKQVLEEKGFHVDFTPGHYVAEEFVEEFKFHIHEGSKVLIPKGNLARDYISASLKSQGAIVDEVIIYETYLPEDSRDKLINMLRSQTLDILTFTSPSTIDHFMEIVESSQLRSSLDHCVIACIGPVSKQKAEEWGLPVHAMPEKYTVAQMLESVIKYLIINPKPEGK